MPSPQTQGLTALRTTSPKGRNEPKVSLLPREKNDNYFPNAMDTRHPGNTQTAESTKGLSAKPNHSIGRSNASKETSADPPGRRQLLTKPRKCYLINRRHENRNP